MSPCDGGRRDRQPAHVSESAADRRIGMGRQWKILAAQGVLWAWLLAPMGGCRPRNDPDQPTPAAEPTPSGVPASRSVQSQTAKADFFADVTSRTGIDFTFSSGRSAGEYAILESLGGGVAAFDYDLDGRVDLMFAGGGSLDDRTVTPEPCGLFRNLGNWQFVDTTGAAGAAAADFYNHGIFPADFDDDGFADLAVSGYGGVQLFRNQGDGTFQPYEVWTSHPENPWSTGLAWGDFDGDGHLDIYVTHYVDWSWDNHPYCRGAQGVAREVCAPREFSWLSDAIYMSDGAGAFTRVAHEVGLTKGGKGLGVVAGDINLNGHLDLYVANDTTDNFLYLNDGQGNFREAALVASVSGDEVGVNTGSMGVVLEDVDNDGLPDLWVTNFERELFALYRNEGFDLFSHISRKAGLAALEGLYVGFGTLLIDIDLDGDRDMVVANGHVSYQSSHSPYRQEPLLLENQGRRRFERLDATGYFASSHTGRGLAHADLDNDGGWDLIFTHLEEPAALLRGRAPADPRWARVQLVGRESNRDAIGATVRISLDSGEYLWMRNSGGSYLSQSDSRLLLVVPPNEQVTEVHVRWPSGREERFPFPRLASDVVWIEGRSGVTP